MVGRKEEISILEDLLDSNKPEFLALYGRRRIGKTYLIKEFFNDSFSFYATGVQNVNTKQQLRVFKEALVKYGDNTKTIPKDWFEAFSRLERLLGENDVTREYRSGKRVVFLDELPWMDTARSDFKSAFDYFWNSWGSSQKDLLLIICGSATSWIINNIVKDTGGFYNRLTRQIRLMPFTLDECEKFLLENGLQFTRKQIIESYMIFGGVPYYLNYLKPQYSLTQNVDMLFFGENCPLKYEFQNMFKALFRNSDYYIEIIRELSKKKYGMTRSELIDSKRVPEGKTLTKCLEDLEQCGFIRKYHDYSSEKNGAHFQMIDPMCLFYLTFMETGVVGSWMDYVETPAYYSWCGLAFERVCLMHTKQIKQKLGIAGVSSNELAWASKKTSPKAQIDLLIDRKDDVINVCEIKYTKEPFSIDSNYENNLIHKVEALRSETGTKKALWITMISFSGLKNNKYKNIVINELTGDDLFDK
ncbi:MAG: ATP-binding protein [Lachnospiraceae bacterium]|nr:ATP-binding protein [Lachnospiraceae bacterium]